jgi:signal transduction histidine kinase
MPDEALHRQASAPRESLGLSGLAVALPGGGAVPLGVAGCIALARAVLAEARLVAEPSHAMGRGGAADGARPHDPGLWSRAQQDPAVGAWLAAVRGAARDGGVGGVDAPSLARRLAGAVIGIGDVSDEGQLLLDVLDLVADSGSVVARFEQAVAEARLDAVRELAYGAGHEINNPLANIAARAQSLLPGERDPDRRRRLSTIVDQAFRARDMIGGLMIFARPPRPHPAIVAIDSVVRHAIESLRPAAHGRGVRLEYSPPPAPVAVHVDATQVGEALRVLAVNALEAVEDGGRVRLEAHDDPAVGVARVMVADDGRGMDSDVARRAFDPFFSGRDAGRGIGLGLPKARRLIESSGGALHVESSPTRGTTVTITLPLAAPAA